MSLDSVSHLRSIERTVDAHHCVPPCAVGIRRALRLFAIWRSVIPALRSAWMWSMTSGDRTDGRPRLAAATGARAGRRCSAISRSSLSTGMSFVPHGISTVSINGRTRRLKVERLTPSASAACVRVYASRSTRVASRTTSAGASAGLAVAWRRTFSLRRLRRRRGTRTEYRNAEPHLHRDASVSAGYPAWRMIRRASEVAALESPRPRNGVSRR